jgi:hypothetical protein
LEVVEDTNNIRIITMTITGGIEGITTRASISKGTEETMGVGMILG